MTPWTDETAFYAVKEHLIKQGRQALDSREAYRYRAPDGTKCAIGALIPDEMYRPDFEGDTVRFLIKNHACVAELFSACDPALLNALQSVHDYGHCWHETDGFVGFKFLQRIQELFNIPSRDQRTTSK